MSTDDKKISLVARPLIDPFKVRRRSELARPRVDIVMDLWQAGVMHRLLKESYASAKNASHNAYGAYRDAERAYAKAYGALASLEAEMREAYEKRGFKEFSEFVTIENDDDEGEGA